MSATFELDYGEADSVYLPLLTNADTKEFAGSGDWTPAAGDVKISKDGAAAANITTLPTIISGMNAWKFTFSAAELQCKTLICTIEDANLADDSFTIHTVSDASAQHITPRDVDLMTEGEVQAASGLLLETTIDTVNSQTEFILTDGGASDDMYNKVQNGLVIAQDVSDANHAACTFCSDYVASTKTLTLTEALPFTAVAGDKIFIKAPTVTVDTSLIALEASVQTAITSIGLLDDVDTTEVNAEMVDALNVDTYAEMTTDPSATPTLREMIQYMYQHTKHRREMTGTSSGTVKVMAADDTTNWVEAPYSDDSTTAIKGKFVAS